MEEWYFTRDGQQEGPVTQGQIQALAKAGQLDSASTLVWREGMEDWKPLRDSGLMTPSLLPKPTLVPPGSPPSGINNPPPAPVDVHHQPVRRSYEVEAQYPGYGRLRYFLVNLILTVVFYAILFVAVFALVQSSDGPGAIVGVGISLLGLGMMAVSLFAAYQRVKNLGMSGWALLWTLVPFVNIWIGWRMVACPPGYEDHRTLDTPGKVISGIMLGLAGLMIVGNIILAVAQA